MHWPVTNVLSGLRGSWAPQFAPAPRGGGRPPPPWAPCAAVGA